MPPRLDLELRRKEHEEHLSLNEMALRALERGLGLAEEAPRHHEDTIRHYAQLFVQLRRPGTPIPVNDLWIAALVLEHGFDLYSRDGHFDHLPQLPRVE